MSGILEGKSILVTGGGSGIGRATACAMAREGARVGVADRNEESAAETAEMVKQLGGSAVAIGVDVTDSAAVARMVDVMVDRFGSLHCAFNNAGISEPALGAGEHRLAELSEDVWRKILAVNLDGVWRCLKQEIGAMLKQGGGGAIVNTASIAGLVGLERRAAYVASKHAVVGLTKAAAVDYAEAGIRVNVICPGYVATPFTSKTMATRGDTILRRVPVQRLGTAEEIAEAVVWLCSERASFVTGATLAADGGYSSI